MRLVGCSSWPMIEPKARVVNKWQDRGRNSMSPRELVAHGNRFGGSRRHTIRARPGGRADDTEATVDQRDLVERARRGDHDAFAAARRRGHRAAGRGRPPDPPGPGARARRGPGGASSEPGGTCPGLRDPDRFDAWLHRLIVNACSTSRAGAGARPIEVELTPIDGPAIGDIAATVADRELLDAALRRLDPEPARGRCRCTTSWECRCPTWRQPWAFRSGRQSPASIDRSWPCAPRSPSRT